MSSTLPISKIAWLHSWLNSTFSFARSSRIPFGSNFYPFNHFCIRICEFFFQNFVLQECICVDFFVSEMSIHFHVGIETANFLEATSTSVEWFETSCTPVWSSLFNHCFEVGTAISFLRLASASFLQSKVRLCQKWVTAAGVVAAAGFANSFSVFGAGLGVSSLSKSTRSTFWAVTRSMQSPGIVV